MPLLAFALVLLLSAWARPGQAMAYAVVPLDDGRCGAACPQAIYASGEIQFDEPQRLLSFVQQVGDGLSRTLVIHSPGGNLAGALKLGQGLRRLGMNVVVASVGRAADGRAVLRPGRCASACVFVLMGGETRMVPDGSRIFVHSPRRAGFDQRDIVDGGFLEQPTRPETVSAVLQHYARQMGIDPALVALADAVPHESARELTPAEIRRFRLASRRR